LYNHGRVIYTSCTNLAALCYQLDWWLGNAKAEFDFRAEGQEFEVFAEYFNDEWMVLVIAVIADLVSRQATAVTYLYCGLRFNHRVFKAVNAVGVDYACLIIT